MPAPSFFSSHSPCGCAVGQLFNPCTRFLLPSSEPPEQVVRKYCQRHPLRRGQSEEYAADSVAPEELDAKAEQRIRHKVYLQGIRVRALFLPHQYGGKKQEFKARLDQLNRKPIQRQYAEHLHRLRQLYAVAASGHEASDAAKAVKQRERGYGHAVHPFPQVGIPSCIQA